MEASKRTIIIIGQNTGSRRALQLALTLEGYGVHAADSTLEGRRLIDVHWPEAVVLDVADGNSPEVLRLARDIRGSRFHRHVIIVASAPVCLPAQERAAYEAGCDAFVIHPAQSREVAELLDAYLPVGTAGADGEMQSAKLWN